MAATLVGRIYSRCVLCGKLDRHQRFWRIRHYQRGFSEAVQKKESPTPWQPVIGLEIHAQIQADTKLFSRSAAKYGAPVNTQVQFLDMALPGTLPVINKRCVEAGLLTALALNCRINKVSRFDRKHYFYADLPAGYQITQQNHAIANDGVFTYMLYGRSHADCMEKTARISQIQLEQDSGKSLHDDVEKQSLIDLNRAGCALMEIVTEPDFHSADEARSFVRDLRRILILLQTCDGKMGEGSLRVDANISVRRKGEPLGVRTEVKNLNSLNSVHKSINYEIQRQINVLKKGGEVVNETRSYDKSLGKTMAMRDKEVKQDYRFMPEPNLPPLHVFQSADHVPAIHKSAVILDELQQQLPELPSTIREYLMSEFECTLFQAGFIVNEGVDKLFVTLARDSNSENFRKFFIHRFINILISMELEPDTCGAPPETISRLYKWYVDGDVGRLSMVKVLELLVKDPSVDPKDVLDQHDLWCINDDIKLQKICEQIFESPGAKSAIKKHQNGQKKEAIQKLMSQAGKATDNKGNVFKMMKIFNELLSNEESIVRKNSK